MKKSTGLSVLGWQFAIGKLVGADRIKRTGRRMAKHDIVHRLLGYPLCDVPTQQACRFSIGRIQI